MAKETKYEKKKSALAQRMKMTEGHDEVMRGIPKMLRRDNPKRK